MCFDLETGKVVLRRTITRFPMPERVIKIINYWGKSQKNAGFKNKLEFWDIMKKNIIGIMKTWMCLMVRFKLNL